MKRFRHVHGTGRPLVLLHGAYMTVDAMGPNLPGLPEPRPVVLPGTAHSIPTGSGVLDRAEWLLAMVPPFLDAATPGAEPSAGGGA